MRDPLGDILEIPPPVGRNGTGPHYLAEPVPEAERGYCPSDESLRREQVNSSEADENPLISGAMDNTAFDAAEFKREWEIEGVLVRHEPGVLAGPSKAMKTGLIVDAAVSVAAARPFLGRFWVPTARRVYVISAESGPITLQARMREVCKAKGVNPAGLPIQWYTEVENLASVEGCRNLANAIQHFGSELVLADPGYLLLAGDTTTDNAGNYYAMGRLLGPIGEACRKLGATLVIATHTNGKLQTGTPPELSHISFAGYSQWSRQWLLLNRRLDYEDDGRHALYLRYGGSAGHSGMVNLDIDEGVLQPDGSGRKWEVSAVDASAARKQEKAAEADKAMDELHKNSAEVLKAMVALIAEGNEVATRNKLGERTGLSRTKLAQAIKLLVGDGAVVEATGEVKAARATKPAEGIRRPDGWA